MSQLGDGAAISSVINRLTSVRLIIAEQDSFVEVSHEALIREWPTLRRWLDEDREGLQIHRHLIKTAQEWNKRNRDESDQEIVTPHDRRGQQGRPKRSDEGIAIAAAAAANHNDQSHRCQRD